jgi:hypothetical protein
MLKRKNINYQNGLVFNIGADFSDLILVNGRVSWSKHLLQIGKSLIKRCHLFFSNNHRLVQKSSKLNYAKKLLCSRGPRRPVPNLRIA